MSRKAFIVIIAVILAFFGAIGWYFISGDKSGTNSGNTDVDSSNPFPFGQGPASNGNANTGSGDQTGDASSGGTIDLSGNQTGPARLRRISTVPTAGAVAFDVGSSTIIRYVERATGHVIETGSDSSSSDQISNITIPKIREALWATNGQNVVLRYLKDNEGTIRTFLGRISTTTKTIEGTFLADDIENIAVLGSRIFYLDESMSGAQGYRANIDGTGKTGVFNSSFGDWKATWASNSVLLFARPSAGMQGSAYILDMSTGAMVPTIDRIPGLQGLLSSDEAFMLYTGANGNSMGTAVYDVKKAVKRDLDIGTIIDKCVWSKKEKTVVYCAIPKSPAAASYPDDWYKGKVAFADSLWKIDAVTGETTDILDPELEAGISMDIVNPSLDQGENVIVFTDKNDLTVWRLNLK